MLKFHVVVAMLLLVLGTTTKAASANLLTNGSFETYTVPPANWTFANVDDFNLPVGDTNITGWTVTRGNIDYYADVTPGAWIAADGHRSVDLAGTPGAGGVSQSFTTVPGLAYLVTFSYSGNPDHHSGNMTGRATVGSTFTNFSFDVAVMQNSVFDMKWQQSSFQFVANAGTTTLEIYNTGASSLWGPALDNVSVTAVPEPASALMVLPAMCVLLAFRHRRTAT